jgi:hypothetical protein
MVASNHGFPPGAVSARPSPPLQLFLVALAVGLAVLGLGAMSQGVQENDLPALVAGAALVVAMVFQLVKLTERIAIAADGLHVWRPVRSFRAAVRRVETTAVPGRLRLSLEGRRSAYNVHIPMLTNGEEFRRALLDHVVRHDIPTDGLDDVEDDH